MKKKNNPRITYAVFFILILMLEVTIALFVRDCFVRPYVGDILVTTMICCFARVVFPDRSRLVPIIVFLFAVCVEIGQYFDFVSFLGLGESRFFRILLGSTFSFMDIVCYMAGCVLFAVLEYLLNNIIMTKRRQ